jgi:hypothetical protein
MKPLRIVHCANFSESKYGAVYYAIDRKLSNGLIRNGHFVYDFSYREVAKNATFFKSKKFGLKKANEALLQTLANIRPDLLLLGHSELITIETLKKAKKAYPHLKIAMWWVDPFEKIDHIPERLSVIDTFFATTGTTYLKQIFGKNTYATLHFFPNICDDSIEAPSFENQTYEYDLLYIGREDERRKDFLEFIKSLKKIKLGMFGQTKANLLLGYHYYDTLQKTKIALNFSRFNDIELYSSDRIIQLTASGVMVMCPKIPYFTRLFGKNEIVYFDSREDFETKLKYYLTHDNERKQIAMRGFHKAHASYNEIRTAQFMLEAIYTLPFSESYEWIEEHA